MRRRPDGNKRDSSLTTWGCRFGIEFLNYKGGRGEGSRFPLKGKMNVFF